MISIDKAILDTNRVICENISHFSTIDRGLLSQNILGQIRNFVEYVAIKASFVGKNIDPHDYSIHTAALKNIERRGNLRFLYRFHKMLQQSVSHYTDDKDASERLMLKYYEYLLKVKLYLKKMHNMDVLENICDFPIYNDTELADYYEKIAERVDSPSTLNHTVDYNDRYYVQKVKPFFVNQKIYYEITFTTANANVSKFDRVIAFTQCEIIDNYAVKFLIHSDTIRILDKETSILVIDSYEVSIRPCEWDNFSEIFGSRVQHSTNSIEYKNMMSFLSSVKMSLTELVNSDQDYYDSIKSKIIAQSQSVKIYQLLDLCRDIIVNNKPGTNVLRYLLYKMNNRVIKRQYSNGKCDKLSNLFLRYGCIPFDCMPYCTSLLQHNPKIYDLFEAIPIVNREHELFARRIKNNTEVKGHLFTPITEIKGFENIDKLMRTYNAHLYRNHTERRLEKYKDNIYIKSYVEDSIKIIEKLQELSSADVSQYTASIDSWLLNAPEINDEGQKEILRQMFTNSRVALVYGPAGTGKSTMIKHVSNFWGDYDKIFLANTHSAVDNMRRKVTAGYSQYMTIAKFISEKNNNTDCDILFIDECSTVSNNDMRSILEKANFKLLVLVGDIYQIESIYFGNWFNIVQRFVPKTSIFELTRQHRAQNKKLQTVWNRVRKLDYAITEPLISSNYVEKLNDSIFEHSEEDEIILCLNYDGLYGINNINRFLQSSNPMQSVKWGINTYKVGDPVLFNESNIFSPLIHNNSKGWIVDIRPEDKQIWFNIELEESINEIEAWDYAFELVGESEKGNSIISFSVNKYRSTDEDDDNYNSTVVPFQVAYAVSIHKAQGLEYDSVKIVITNEIEDKITHDIFYTAITRAKNKLKIYWSPETQQSVISNLKLKNSNRDADLLAQFSSLKMVKK